MTESRDPAMSGLTQPADLFPTNQEIAAIPESIFDAPVGTISVGGEGLKFFSDSTPVRQSYQITLPFPQTEQGMRCLALAAQALELFVAKNAAYGDPDDDDLGARGQYADMHRKWKRIKRHLWDNEPWPQTGETFEEVLFDFIGHILLTADFKRQGK